MPMRILAPMLTLLMIGAASAAETTTPRDRFVGRVDARFATADVNGDGYLTRPEAQEGFPFVSRHFDEMDVDVNGGVTKAEMQHFARERAEARRAPPQ
ncbi:EF-hand domain-containing protein [Thiococcus pfennigii]|jgi:hypothetical protein|uniref:EF-hand domain-containing protein n=1 Tax=Thiococcus pfennigii TaxID=1057 RepID=UPI00190364A6|nr:EF-hand domain-containing protein [Thiococcus pfennigii]MBK1699353.1 hypothetical protein [Thiococcus pfennigii]MBK1730928.1 hypothetical protein [Thiococcus pfennigii]